MKISYFVIEKNKIAHTSPDLDAAAIFKALKILPLQKVRKSDEIGLALQSYKGNNYLPDSLIIFTLGDNSVVCVFPENIRKGRNLRKTIRLLWDSNNIKNIALSSSERPEFLSFDENAKPKEKYPFITLGMKWPKDKIRYEYANRCVNRLRLPEKNKPNKKNLFLAIATTLSAAAIIAGIYYLYISKGSDFQQTGAGQIEREMKIENE